MGDVLEELGAWDWVRSWPECDLAAVRVMIFEVRREFFFEKKATYVSAKTARASLLISLVT